MVSTNRGNGRPGAPPELRVILDASRATAAAIPLFSNLGAVGATSGLSLANLGADYRIDAILTMAESKGLLKILSRPRIVTQNNIGANVKQGVKIPVVTQAQLGGPPTTTYIDAQLRLQVTPQITVENTIFLNVDVENTSPDFSIALTCCTDTSGVRILALAMNRLAVPFAMSTETRSGRCSRLRP